MRETTIRDDISKIIDDNDINHKDISKSNLTTLVLSEVFSKNYFNNNYKNSFILQDFEGALWNTTGNMSSIDVTGISGVVSSPDKNSDYESQFAWEEESKILITKKSFESVKSIYKIFKNSNDIKEAASLIQDIVNNDKERLFLFHSLFASNIASDNLYLSVMSNVTVENNKSDDYKNKIPCSKKGDLKNSNYLYEINNENYEEYKIELLKNMNKTIKKLKNLDSITNKHKNKINTIIKHLDKLHPEMNKKPETQNLNFYFIETKMSDNGFFNNNKFEAVDKIDNIVKNLESCSDFYDKNENFIDFLYKNPFSYSEYNRSKVNLIEGLNYLTDDLLKPNDYGNQFFLIAKTSKGETVGSLSLDKSKSYNHLFKITGMCVKSSFRNKGVSKQIYQKLAEISIHNNMIIHNNNYTADGRSYLPKMKLNILNENPKFILIDERIEKSITDEKINNAFEAFNGHALRKIKEMEMSNKTNIKKTINAYIEGKKIIFNNSNNEISYEDLCNKGLKVFISKIEDKTKNKLKKIKAR